MLEIQPKFCFNSPAISNDFRGKRSNSTRENKIKKKKKSLLVRLKPRLLDIYMDYNVQSILPSLYKYFQYDTVCSSDCTNIKICRQIIWKGVKMGSILIIPCDDICCLERSNDKIAYTGKAV